MKKKALTLGLLAALPLLAHAASHRKIVYIDQYDQDQDGRVSSIEFEQARRARFDATDTDHSATVSIEEYVFEWEDRLDAQLAVDRKEQVTQTANRFKALDDDSNGILSRAEFDASGAASFQRFDSDRDGIIDAADVDARAEAGERQRSEMSREQILVDQKRMLDMPSTHSKAGTIEVYDADADGVVTLAEFARGRDAQYAAMDGNGDGGVDVDEYTVEFENRVDAALAAFRKASVDQARVRFGALDADADGSMTFREYQNSGHGSFERWDTDHDGYVTLEEADPAAGREFARAPRQVSARSN